MTQLTHWIPERWRETLADLRDDLYEAVERWLPGRRHDGATRNGNVPVRYRAQQPSDASWTLPRPFDGNTAIDLSETDDEIVVTADLPGLAPDDFTVEVTGERLVIRGEKRQESSRQERGYSYRERRYGAFARAVQLPCEIEVERAKADYKRGVLHITLPKTERAKASRVKIQVKG